MSSKSRSSARAESRLAALGGSGPRLLTEQLKRAQVLLSVTDPVEGELHVAAMLTTARVGGMDPELSDLFVSATIEFAGDRPSPESAALLRTIAAIGSRSARRAAIEALGAVTHAGHYPPEWTARLGQAKPVQAWRRSDVFGDSEIIAVTFRYGDAPDSPEHAMVVQVDLSRVPVATRVAVVPGGDLGPVIEREVPLTRVEPLELSDVRRRIEEPLDRCDRGESPDVDETSLVCLPVARARMRRLPAGDEADAKPIFGAADRRAAVTEFLASREATDLISQESAGAGAADVVRFWAEVLTGYSAFVPGDPPTRVGLRKLSEVLLYHVPYTFALSSAQRQGMPDAVLAWTRWAAGKQGLEQAAVTHLSENLPTVLEHFDEVYDRPEMALARGYVADVSAARADGEVLQATLLRRQLAVPPPDARAADGGLEGLDASDPENRRTIVENEFAECDPPSGMDQDEFVAAAVRIAEELWHDEPPETWRAAARLTAKGMSDHDVMHELIKGTAAG